MAATRVAHLAACAQRLGAPLVSEHIAFVRAGGIEAGHLLPVPRSREALEPIAALFDWLDDELSEVA